ncbi:nuclear transport factor 2 family protein [Aquitalea aquatica]|uniref:Nuclear transport factor 2 family protein n=1 Tax=Aquitalea aquatica TaxID=3044273 RepID=A0A838XVS9_9NEIS|nr:nuclear transport factor 2 family protein [Aquitalea magnusonii]MBA4707240.1 nuclear transport factor 2 family protein [Aquitalea magnusonii]
MDKTAQTAALSPAAAAAAPAGAALRAQLSALVGWYSQLTPHSLEQLPLYYAATVSFKDPFNTVHSRAGVRLIFEHMFRKLEQPRFVVLEQLLDGQQAFLSWDFHFRLRGKDYCLHGGSHLRFNEDGLLILHRDYWDSAEELLHKLPLIGAPLRLLRRLLSVCDEDRPA